MPYFRINDLSWADTDSKANKIGTIAVQKVKPPLLSFLKEFDMHPIIKKVTLAAAAMLIGSGAMAATSVNALTATATVLAACTIGPATLGFGNYDPGNATPTDVATTVAVQCTNGSLYSIYSTTAVAGRAMITNLGGTGERLTFGVYGSAANRTAGTQLPVTNTTGSISGTGTGAAQNVNLFGRVAAQQNVVAGIYTNAAAPTNLTIEY